ncbi:hypothetical protein HMPREF3156_00993 [Neisseria sp. HMSC06F02]|nr:hypothetical protein HMPREF3156_00993 [Neisseria sp. HMSC06F02]
MAGKLKHFRRRLRDMDNNSNHHGFHNSKTTALPFFRRPFHAENHQEMSCSFARNRQSMLYLSTYCR